jgi:hypothetical protein
MMAFCVADIYLYLVVLEKDGEDKLDRPRK